MIPKKLKYTLAITLLALSTACLATGCKRSYDKIDLSGSQASEGTVQTAPASTTIAETESSSNITIEPGIENAQSQGTSAGGSAAAPFPVCSNRHLSEWKHFHSVSGHFRPFCKGWHQ